MELDSQPLTLETLRSKIGELTDFITISGDNSELSSSDTDDVLCGFVTAVETKGSQIVAEHSDVAHFSDKDLDAYLDWLRNELEATETEIAVISEEIESLSKSYVEGTCRLESNLESLHHVVDCAQIEVLEQTKAVEQYQNLANTNHDDSFEVLKLKHQIETNKLLLKSLEDLDLNLKRVEAIEKVQEALTGLKVIDVEGDIIRVSLKTYIPDVQGLLSQAKVEEVNHQLLIEVLEGNMELKNVEIFPNDVYLGEILEAAKTFSKEPSVSGTRKPLGWFLQKVQDKIVSCTLRQLVVKIANESSRHSFEYLDKDESVTAHMAGGVDAFLKPSQGWPLPGFALELVSLRSSAQNSKEISLALLSKVEEVANSLELDIRKGLTDFVDSIEKILLDKMRPELH